jgi:hypothetical protein
MDHRVMKKEGRWWLITTVRLPVVVGLITLVDGALIALFVTLLAGNC